MTGLENKISEFIEKAYCCKCNANIKVEHCDGMYYLKLFLINRCMNPLVIAFQTDDEEKFLDFVYKELKTRQLHKSQFFQLEKA